METLDVEFGGAGLTERQGENFDAKVDRSGGADACWPWMGSRNPAGYGYCKMLGENLAHRVSFRLHKGAIPDDRPRICHSCDNPPCCNPAHLWAGTDKDNSCDREQKSRGNHAVGERHCSRTKPHRIARGEGHGLSKLTEAQVRAIWDDYHAGAKIRDLAKKHGCSFCAVQCITSGQTWTHLNLIRPPSACRPAH
jgi:hypothetical protein